MGTIIVKTTEKGVHIGDGALLHIPEELWELARKHTLYVEDNQTGERVLVIDMNIDKKELREIKKGGE